MSRKPTSAKSVRARDTAAISARFSAAAETYDDHADIQRQAALGVLDLVSAIEPPDRILDIGSGTGVLTAMIADAFPRARIDAIDISPSVVERARLHFAGNRRVVFHVADARQFRSRRRYSLIASNASLHWMAPLTDTFRRLLHVLADDGQFAFSIMLAGTLAELRESRMRVAPHKPPRANLPTREFVLAALSTAGFRTITEKVVVFTAEYPSPRDLLYSMHRIGVTAGPVSQSRPDSALLTRKELASLLADYAKSYSRRDGGVWASFEIMQVLAVEEHST